MATHTDGPLGITTTQAYERAAVDQVIAIAHLTIVELQARLEVARRRLIDLEAAAAAGDALAARVGRFVLDAQGQILTERLQARRTAAAIADAADVVAAAIRGSDRAPDRLATADASIGLDGLVLDLTARVSGDETPHVAAQWDDERIAAS